MHVISSNFTGIMFLTYGTNLWGSAILFLKKENEINKRKVMKWNETNGKSKCINKDHPAYTLSISSWLVCKLKTHFRQPNKSPYK